MFTAPSLKESVIITLTGRQRQWLSGRGGRTMADVLIDEDTGEPYVLMGSGEKGIDKRVGIPSDDALRQYEFDHYRGR